MAKEKNTLNPAFYKMMDNFLDPFKSWIALSDSQMTGYDLATTQDFMQEEHKLQSKYGNNYQQMIMNNKIPYEEISVLNQQLYYEQEYLKEEYDLWLDCLKMQFDVQTLHKYLPKKTELIEFFSDVQLRMPHEKTLLIQEYDKNSCALVSIKETKAKDFKKKIKPIALNNSAGVISRRNKLHPKRIFNSWNLKRNESVYEAKISVFTNLTHDSILNKEEHDLKDISFLTRPTCFSVPVSFSFPAGLSLDKYQYFHPTKDEGIKSLITSYAPNKTGGSMFKMSDPYFAPIFFPDSFRFKNKILNTEKQQYYLTNTEPFNIQASYMEMNDAAYMLVMNAMTHMSIYSHPDFREFCVRKLKKQGQQPQQITLKKGEPFKKQINKPKFEHYLLDLTIPAESDDHTDGEAGKKRYHLVRGHLMRTNKGKFTWRQSHWRGNKKLGVITKDYNIEVDRRIKNDNEDSFRIN
tara:strand:+ start:4128 stop:5519 length:1392 start_codon:yes stop_codon:yes gene_type:complete